MRNVKGSDWVAELAGFGVVIPDGDAFAATLCTVSDPAVIEAVVKVFLGDKLPDALDQAVGALIQNSENWKQPFDALMEESRGDLLSQLLCEKLQRGSI